MAIGDIGNQGTRPRGLGAAAAAATSSPSNSQPESGAGANYNQSDPALRGGEFVLPLLGAAGAGVGGVALYQILQALKGGRGVAGAANAVNAAPVLNAASTATPATAAPIVPTTQESAILSRLLGPSSGGATLPSAATLPSSTLPPAAVTAQTPYPVSTAGQAALPANYVQSVNGFNPTQLSSNPILNVGQTAPVSSTVQTAAKNIATTSEPGGLNALLSKPVTNQIPNPNTLLPKVTGEIPPPTGSPLGASRLTGEIPPPVKSPLTTAEIPGPVRPPGGAMGGISGEGVNMTGSAAVGGGTPASNMLSAEDLAGEAATTTNAITGGAKAAAARPWYSLDVKNLLNPSYSANRELGLNPLRAATSSEELVANKILPKIGLEGDALAAAKQAAVKGNSAAGAAIDAGATAGELGSLSGRAALTGATRIAGGATMPYFGWQAATPVEGFVKEHTGNDLLSAIGGGAALGGGVGLGLGTIFPGIGNLVGGTAGLIGGGLAGAATYLMNGKVAGPTPENNQQAQALDGDTQLKNLIASAGLNPTGAKRINDYYNIVRQSSGTPDDPAIKQKAASIVTDAVMQEYALQQAQAAEQEQRTQQALTYQALADKFYGPAANEMAANNARFSGAASQFANSLPGNLASMANSSLAQTNAANSNVLSAYRSQVALAPPPPLQTASMLPGYLSQQLGIKSINPQSGATTYNVKANGSSGATVGGVPQQ